MKVAGRQSLHSAQTVLSLLFSLGARSMCHAPAAVMGARSCGLLRGRWLLL